MPATRPQMQNALLARSRQPDWNRFFQNRIRRRAATPASNLDAGGHGKTVRDDEGFRSTTAIATSREPRSNDTGAPGKQQHQRLHGEFKTWHVQDLARPACTARIGLSLTLGALRGGLVFLTAALGIELFMKRKRPRRGLLTVTPRLLQP
jgi:hypothetical protein